MTSIFETKLGWVGIEGNSNGLTHLIFPQRCKKKIVKLLEGDEETCYKSYTFLGDSKPMERASIEKHTPQVTWYSEKVQGEDSLIRCVRKDLIAYLDGLRICFDYPVDLHTFPPFVVKVLEIVRTVPYGKTQSYLWVAEKIGGKQFARAVGQALSKNPLPIIIPCHRVIKSDGGIGGFTGGIFLKKKLHKIEGIVCVNNGD